jgi:hypothetical protein
MSAGGMGLEFNGQKSTQKGKRVGGSRNTPLTGVTQNPKTPNGSGLLTPNKMIRPNNNNGISQSEFGGGQKFATAGISQIPTSGFMVNTNKDVS